MSIHPLCLYLKTFETFPDFLLVGKGLFVDLVADIFDEVHDSFSLFDIFSKFSESSESNYHLLQLVEFPIKITFYFAKNSTN